MIQARIQDEAAVSVPIRDATSGMSEGADQGMRLARPSVLMIGALPPPFIGPAVAMDELLRSDRLRACFEVLFCDISDPREIDSIGRFETGNIR